MNEAERFMQQWRNNNPPMHLTIIATTWNDYYGNTYYSSNVYMNGDYRDDLSESYAYGYGSCIENDTFKKMIDLGIVPEQILDSRRYLELANIKMVCRTIRVDYKRNMLR